MRSDKSRSEFLDYYYLRGCAGGFLHPTRLDTLFADIHPDSGPVFYYEGSHVINPYNMQDFGLEVS